MGSFFIPFHSNTIFMCVCASATVSRLRPSVVYAKNVEMKIIKNITNEPTNAGEETLYKENLTKTKQQCSCCCICLDPASLQFVVVWFDSILNCIPSLQYLVLLRFCNTERSLDAHAMNQHTYTATRAHAFV